MVRHRIEPLGEVSVAKRKLECDLDHDRPRAAAVRLEIKSTRASKPGHPMVRTAALCAAHARELREMGLEIVGP
jgi:hypothetical protein